MIPDKKGKTAGINPRQSHEGPRTPARQGAEYKFQPGDRDVAIWDDECNYDPGLSNFTPLNGCEATAYKLALEKGIRKT